MKTISQSMISTSTVSREDIGVVTKVKTAERKPAVKRKRYAHAYDSTFIKFREAMQRQFEVSRTELGPIMFKTDIENDRLYNAYLNSFDLKRERDAHKCECCRQFLRQYGNIIFVRLSGVTVSALFGDSGSTSDFPPLYRRAVHDMKDIIESAPIVSPFFNTKTEWGTNFTKKWPHMRVYNGNANPSFFFRPSDGKTVDQIVAEKVVNFQTVKRTFDTYSMSLVNRALSHLQKDEIYRSEQVLPAATWLHDLYIKVSANSGILDKIFKMRTNAIIWREAVTAPIGFVNIRNGVLGTFLDDLKKGVPVETAMEAFERKMQPDKFRRPQSLPTRSAVAVAQKHVDTLGIARSFERRFAYIDEIRKIWERHDDLIRAEDDTHRFKTGLFANVRTKDDDKTPVNNRIEEHMSFSRFRRTIMPNALSIQIKIPTKPAPFCAFTTADYEDAKPIIKWDDENLRNPFAWYVYKDGSTAQQWNLPDTTSIGGSLWNPVNAISFLPSMWNSDFPDDRKAVLFVMDGCRDLEGENVGSALFPEILKSDLNPMRKVVESYSMTSTMSNASSATACGLLFDDDSTEFSLNVRMVGGAFRWISIHKWD